MKNKLLNFISFLIMLVLIAGLVFFGWILYKALFDADTDKVETAHTSSSLLSVDDGSTEVTTDKTEKRSFTETIADLFTTQEEEEINYTAESSVGKYFYEQLSENQKIIYNGLQANKDNMTSGTTTIQFGSKFSDILEDENGSKTLGDDYQSAIEAFTHDNPDFFYVDITKLYLNIETKKRALRTTYNVYLAPQEGSTYFAKGFKSKSDVEVAKAKIESVKSKVKAKLTGNRYKDIKIIHDYLIENIEYDQNYTSNGTYTIYGAFVDKKCVCDGYTKAFKCLADMAGIDCLIMQGTATNSNGQTESHAWNTVSIDNKWYLLDTTWDDPIIIGTGFISSSVHYKYFLKGTNVFYKDHVLETKFSDNGKNFTYPQISTLDYK